MVNAVSVMAKKPSLALTAKGKALWIVLIAKELVGESVLTVVVVMSSNALCAWEQERKLLVERILMNLAYRRSGTQRLSSVSRRVKCVYCGSRMR